MDPSRDQAGAVAVAVFGVVLVAAVASHGIAANATFPVLLLGSVVPILAGGGLALAGFLLPRAPYDSRRVAVWTLVGAAVLSVLAGVVVAYQEAVGGHIADYPQVAFMAGSFGGLSGMLAGIFDARSRHRLDRLRETERRLSLVTENLREVVWLFDAETGEVEYVSPAYESVYGQPRERLYEDATAFAEVVHSADRDALLDSMASAVAGDPDAVDEHREFRLRRDGETRWVETHSFPVVEDGRVAQVAGISADITDRKRREQALARERETVDLLHGVLRHDVVNEMNLLLAKAESLRADVDRAELDTIVDAGTEVVDLVGTVRTLVEAVDDDDVPHEPVDLGTLLRNLAERTTDDRDRVTVTVETPDDPVEVLASDLLSAVFENLVHNAVEHSDRETPTLHLSLARDGDRAVVRVADDGPGISAEQRDTVFEKGWKGGGSTGTGFGLYMVELLVERHGGTVHLEDNEPRGTVAVVDLPLAEQCEDPIPAAHALPRR